MKKTRSGIEYEVTTGNVFADLGLPDPEVSEMKTRVALEIQRRVKERKLTQARVAALTKLSQPNVSALMNMRLQGFSLERLIETAGSLGSRVELQVNQASHGKARRPVALPAPVSASQLKQIASMAKKAQKIERDLHDFQRQSQALLEQLGQADLATIK